MAETQVYSRVAFDQLKAMIDFMGQHLEFASGNFRTLEARHTSKRLWEELTKILNNSRVGIKKNSDGWSRYWSDFKNKLKQKVRYNNKLKKLGSTDEKLLKSLTKLEKRTLVILGPQFQKRIARTDINTFENSMLDEVSNKIKTEIYHDNNQYCNAPSSDTNKILASDRNNDDNMDSSHEDNGDSDCNNSTEPELQRHKDLYPKWLIDVEQKRAEAELIRADADVKQANAATKNAEASMIQAEALKKMSEAASVQADAIMRIALALEARQHRRDLLEI